MLVHRVQISKKVSDAQDFYHRHSISPRYFRKYRCFNASTTSHLLVILHNMIMHESKLYKKSFPKLFEMWALITRQSMKSLLGGIPYVYYQNGVQIDILIRKWIKRSYWLHNYRLVPEASIGRKPVAFSILKDNKSSRYSEHARIICTRL